RQARPAGWGWNALSRPARRAARLSFRYPGGAAPAVPGNRGSPGASPSPNPREERTRFMRAVSDPRLEELLDRWDDLRAVGRNPSAVDLTQDPDLLPRLEAAIAEIAAIEKDLGGAPLPPSATARGVPQRFESLAYHAEGGMGIVYRAWD